MSRTGLKSTKKKTQEELTNEEFDYFRENYWKIDAYNQLLKAIEHNKTSLIVGSLGRLERMKRAEE